VSPGSAVMPGLEVEGLAVHFGGLTAVSGLTLAAPAGAITGLIGPNGAGKTTTFNACTGSVSASSGHVRLGSCRLDGKGTAARASAGLGRTFQRMELFDSMTVRENVTLGPEAHSFSCRRWGHLIARGHERREIVQRADAAMERCGIVDLASRNVSVLSTGQRRLVELARALATPFTFLLLDEPSSGLDVQETETFAQILTGHVADTGMGLLLIEHDMALVAAVCSYVYVLDFGRLIYQGSVSDTLSSRVVRAAYLGSEWVDAPDDDAVPAPPLVKGEPAHA
jgi:ABC-type branched-subunit amino acid transport system ATPase component